MHDESRRQQAELQERSNGMPVLEGERTRRVTDLNPLAVNRWQIDELQELHDESFGFFEEIVHISNSSTSARKETLRPVSRWPRSPAAP